MEGEVVCSHLRIKFSSTLEEAKTDLSSSLPILSRFQTIERLINTTTENSTRVADQLYDLTDALSECIIFAHERRKEAAASKKGLYFIRKLLFENNMKRRVDEIENKLKGFGPQEETGKLEIQKTYPDVPNPSLITGFDAQVGEIEDLLMKSSTEDDKGHRFKAIGIVGRCGCGKTALTQKVFASRKIENHFFPRIWVCLSHILLDKQGSDLRVAVLKHILREMGTDASDLESSTSVVKLLEKLQLRLMGKRYLIVLDDAWRMEDWFEDVGCSNGQTRAESFTHGLPKGSGGAVIATGRGGRVIKRMVGEEHVIRPQLSDESCGKILSDALQQQGKISPDDLKTITKNCEGLPLAAKILAKLIPV